MDLKMLDPFAKTLPRQLVFNAPRSWDAAGKTGPLGPSLREYESAYKELGYASTPNDDYGWDPAKIVVYALRKLGPGASAEQLRDYIEKLRGFPGIGGTYDFTAGDQHGLGDDAVIVVAYDPVHRGFVAVSKPGGIPLTTSR
jgi:ABC-type branched-subunit amino acid transport system substrate-binding protein